MWFLWRAILKWKFYFLEFLSLDKVTKKYQGAQTPSISWKSFLWQTRSVGPALGSKPYICQVKSLYFHGELSPLWTEFPIVGDKRKPTIPSFHAIWLEFFDATFQNQATFNRCRGKTQFPQLKHTNLIKSSTKTQLPCSFCLKLRIFLDFFVATNPTPATKPTFPKFPGQRPTEKRIFYAGSTMGPNRMVPCHKKPAEKPPTTTTAILLCSPGFFSHKKNTHKEQEKISVVFYGLISLILNFFFWCVFRIVGCHLVKFFLGEICVTFMKLPRSAAHQWCHHLLAINPCNYPRSETSKWVFQMGVSFFFFSCLGGLGGWDLSWVEVEV